MTGMVDLLAGIRTSKQIATVGSDLLLRQPEG
jgi:hypothetical protein